MVLRIISVFFCLWVYSVARGVARDVWQTELLNVPEMENTPKAQVFLYCTGIGKFFRSRTIIKVPLYTFETERYFFWFRLNIKSVGHDGLIRNFAIGNF